MTPPRGAPRKLTDDQIHDILAWHDARRQFRNRQGTLMALAERLGVSRYAVSWCIGHAKAGKSWHSRHVRLTPSQRRAILAWLRRADAFRERHGTLQELARRLDVHPRTLQRCIRRLGSYCQVTAAELPAERRRAKARGGVFTSRPERDWRVSLLREWLSSMPTVEEPAGCSISLKPFGVKEADFATPGSLGCACVWLLIQSVESRGITVRGVTENGRSARWFIPYAQITRLLPAGALERRIRRGRARLSSDQRAALMRPVFGF
jgi:AraC-like DNA-binding protein